MFARGNGTNNAGKKARRLKPGCVKHVCQLWQDHDQKLYENNETLERARGIFVVCDERGNAGWLHNVCRADSLQRPTTTPGATTTAGGGGDTGATATRAGAGGSGDPDGE
jgi:hypothetical protein